MGSIVSFSCMASVHNYTRLACAENLVIVNMVCFVFGFISLWISYHDLKRRFPNFWPICEFVADMSFTLLTFSSPVALLVKCNSVCFGGIPCCGGPEGVISSDTEAKAAAA